MKFENKFETKWLSTEETIKKGIQAKKLETLETELLNIKDSLELIKEKQRRLANLAKLYS